MTLQELINEARNVLDDEIGSNSEILWSDAELVRYINDAEDRMCQLVRILIIDSSTSAICSVAISDGTASYALHAKIIDIDGCKTTKYTYPLVKRPKRWLDLNLTNWTSTSAKGLPQYFCLDYRSRYITFAPVPSANDTATLTVYRRPVTPLALSAPQTAPEIHEAYHMDLLPWVFFRCFSKNDVETLNKAKAAEHKAEAITRWQEIQRELLRIQHAGQPPTIPRGLL